MPLKLLDNINCLWRQTKMPKGLRKLLRKINDYRHLKIKMKVKHYLAKILVYSRAALTSPTTGVWLDSTDFLWPMVGLVPTLKTVAQPSTAAIPVPRRGSNRMVPHVVSRQTDTSGRRTVSKASSATMFGA